LRRRRRDLSAARREHRHPLRPRAHTARRSAGEHLPRPGRGRDDQGGGPLVLDDRVRAVLARLEREDVEERELGLPPAERSRQVARATGQFLFAFVAPQTDCEVLEIGGSRGYSTIWLASGVRYLGGRVLSLEHDPAKIEAWRANIADAGLEDWADLVEGDAFEKLPTID